MYLHTLLHFVTVKLVTIFLELISLSSKYNYFCNCYSYYIRFVFYHTTPLLYI